MNKPKVITIVGPTASGKTEFSIKTAEKLLKSGHTHVEIISADSRQVYKHISIATAQPSKEELQKFKHHFVNELEIDKDFNAGEFGKKGREIIQKIFDSGNIPIIVGGSGLYIDSLIYGLFDYDELYNDDEFKKTQKAVRTQLYEKLNNEGIEKLTTELKEVDPETVNSMDHVTERRIIRALEVYYLTGIPISVHRSKKIDINFEPEIVGINPDREELYNRINNRVELMLEEGLIEEIKSLKNKGYHYKDYNSLNTVGIKEVFDYLEEKISYDTMVELIKQNTRRFAKRQMTWFRRYKLTHELKKSELVISVSVKENLK